MSVSSNSGNYIRLRKKRPKIVTLSARKERNLSIKKVSIILQKDESTRTKEENELLFNYSEIVKEAALRIEKRRKIKERLKEIEDSEAVLDSKCKELAEAILKSEYLVVYTGAGISTAARIPDYRGASGIWTLLQQGKDIGTHDLTQADPTYTHMALFELYSQGKLKHIVSQNCDGLHLRSGLPKQALSEVHGNMYIEVCRTCRPIIEYLRLFDVTENTGRYSHKTMRRCYKCNSSLVDSIVHFGERGNLPWPLNWKGACKAAEKADMILCIGSSLKVLKKYPWLWCMDKPAKRRPLLYIVNLQWTPKDCQATIKINGKCDTVMNKLMKYLSITVPEYSRKLDPIFRHATALCKEERHTTNRPLLMCSKPENIEEEIIKSESHPIELNCEQEIKKEDKLDYPVYSNFKNELQESCVTSCKKEIIIDTGQDDMKFIKKELILITIRSGNNFKNCCKFFNIDQSHECDCPNFIDEQFDIPVIMEDDLLVLKNNYIPAVKTENLITSSIVEEINLNVQNKNTAKESKTVESVPAGSSKVSSLRSILVNENFTNFSKRTSDVESENSYYKKQKIKCENHIDTIKTNAAVESSNTNSKQNTHLAIKNKSKNVEEKKQKKLDSTKNSFKCSFCFEQYFSNVCLFYVKREPVFKKNARTCDCCSSEEEELAETSEEKSDDPPKIGTNPGWYGKGFRKNTRKKR